MVLLLSGCSPKHSDVIVAKVGANDITLPDYENLYIKSNGSREHGQNATQEDREKFLDLMTKFRLKLTDAYQQRLDTRPDVMGEIQRYQGSIAASYLADREITRPGIKKMYDRQKDEIRASHILLSLSPTASLQDSTAAFAKAYELISALKSGADFGLVALEHSQDPSAKQNKGDLYYFTAGQMVPPFEDAVYALKLREITSDPVRTQFGLHIIKMIDRKPVPGEIKCSHIMIRFERNDPTPDDTLAAYKRISAIQDSLAMGLDLADLAVRNSEDPGSAPRGGDLDWFSRRRWILPFDEVAFTLKPGQISHIVRTVYGYHLIKCTDARPPKSFDEVKKDLEQLYRQNRFQDDYKRFITKLKKETRFSIDGNVVSRFIAACDSSKSTRDTAWTAGISRELRASAIMRFDQRPVTVDSVIALITNDPDFSNVPLTATQSLSMLDKVGEQLAFAAKADMLARENPEFVSIMKEYKDGILLYQIEQERVWNRITVNDSLLHAFFHGHRDQFMYPDRVDISEIHVVSDSIAGELYKDLKSAKTLEQLVYADSLRMTMPTRFQALFEPRSAKLTPQPVKRLKEIAQELRADASVKLQLTAHLDTTKRKRQNESIALQRIDAIISYLSRSLGIASGRITSSSRPIAKSLADTNAAATRKMAAQVDIEIVGRKPIVVGGVQSGIYTKTLDERTTRADSLNVGTHTAPFQFKGYYVIVRLNRRDSTRQKTFEEAGTEVSSAFQEFESKRLESEWLGSLRTRYPVVVYKQELKKAFAPGQ